MSVILGALKNIAIIHITLLILSNAKLLNNLMLSNYTYDTFQFALEYTDYDTVLRNFNDWIKYNTTIYVNPKVELKYIDDNRRFGVIALEAVEYREIVARIPLVDQMCNAKFEVVKLDLGSIVLVVLIVH